MKFSTWLPLAFFVAAGAACGSKQPAPAGPPPPHPATPDAGAAAGPVARTGALARAHLLDGDWTIPASSVPVAFLRPGGATSAIYGVIGSDVPILVIVDERADAPGQLQLFEYEGKVGRECHESDGHPASDDDLVFDCPTGGSVAFHRNGSDLDLEQSTANAGPDTAHLAAADGRPAPALEDADRAFAADTAARGADGWVAHYADGAVEWHGTDLLAGKDAIRADIAKTLSAVSLSWSPDASRMLVTDGLGVTAGSFVAKAGDKVAVRGTYLTLWRKAGHEWQVILDTGRPDR